MHNYRRHFKSWFTKLPARSFILLLIFACCIFLFTWISHEVLIEKEDNLDLYLLDALSTNLDRPWLTSIMQKVTYFGSASILKILYGLIILPYILVKKYRRALEIFIIGAGGFLLSDVLKLAFHRERPLHSMIGPVAQFSFPSGHAMAGFIFYGLLVYLLYRSGFPRFFKILLSFILLLFSTLIGFSRIYLRAHYPSDVLAGICIGMAWLILIILLFEKSDKNLARE